MGDVKRAARAAEDDWMTTALRTGARVNARDSKMRTALHYACESTHKYMPIVVDVLLKSGAEVNAQDESGRTPLHDVCTSVNRGIGIRRLEAGPEDITLDRNRNKPINLVCNILNGRMTVQEAGVEDPDAQDASGRIFRRLKAMEVNAQNERESTPPKMTCKRSIGRKVVTLLEAGAEVDAQDESGKTPLFLACMYSNLSIVVTLLEAGAEVNVQDVNGRTPLHVGCISLNRRLLLTILEDGVESNAPNDSSTPLFEFRVRLNHSVVVTLLDAGAEVNARDARGITPLHEASISLNGSIVGTLLEAGAEVNAQARCGQTPLHEACMRLDRSVVVTLLEAGAEVNARDVNGRTPLHEASIISNRSIVGTLLEAGAEANAQSRCGQTPLHEACMKLNRSIVVTLLSHGADKSVIDFFGMTPLHYVAHSEFHTRAICVASVLLENSTTEGSEGGHAQDLPERPEEGDQIVFMLNKQNVRGNTALHLASDRNNKEVVDLFLSLGAKSAIKNVDGMTALHMAVHAHSEDVVNVLLGHGADINATDMFLNTPLHIASFFSDVEIVRLLLRMGAKVGVRNESGKTALHMAGEGVMPPETLIGDFLGVLVANGEDLNAQDNSGHTPLQLAILAGNVYIAYELVSMGANLELRDGDGMTALHWAVCSRNYAEHLVYCLVENGAYVSAKDFDGNTPLHLCDSATEECRRAVSYLIIKGAQIDEQNNHLKTPYEEIANRSSEIGFPELVYIEKLFITHVIRLKTLGVQDVFNINFRLKTDFYDTISKLCVQEIEFMKSMKLVKHVTMYDVLSHINQPYLLTTEDVLNLEKCLCSIDPLLRFQMYGYTLMVSFERAKRLTLAVLSFYTERRKQIVKQLPHTVAEHLLTFLSNEDLTSFTDSE